MLKEVPGPVAAIYNQGLKRTDEGLEGEEHLITQPERIRESYLTNFTKYLETLRAGCIGSNVDYSLVDTSRPLDAVLGEFIDKRASAFAGASSGARQ